MAVSNGRSHLFFIQHARVDLACVPFWSAPGFAIPIFRTNDRSNVVYIQRVDLSDKIEEFETFDDPRNLVNVRKPCEASIGDNEIFAIVDPDYIAHAGSKATLARIVAKWVAEVKPPITRMNFAYFCGDFDLASRAAREAVEIKTIELRDKVQAIRWFLDAAVITELVSSMCTQEDYIAKFAGIFSNSTILNVNISAPYINVMVTQPGAERLRTKRARAKVDIITKLVSAIGYKLVIREEYEHRQQPFYDHIKSGDHRLINREEEDATARRVTSALSEIRQSRRQERRIALVMDSILSDPNVGAIVLASHIDKAAFARKIFEMLRNALEDSKLRTNLEYRVAQVMGAAISSAYPFGKGPLLLELARALGKYRSMSDIIRVRTQRSFAHNVVILRDEILKELSR